MPVTIRNPVAYDPTTLPSQNPNEIDNIINTSVAKKNKTAKVIRDEVTLATRSALSNLRRSICF